MHFIFYILTPIDATIGYVVCLSVHVICYPEFLRHVITALFWWGKPERITFEFLFLTYTRQSEKVQFSVNP